MNAGKPAGRYLRRSLEGTTLCARTFPARSLTMAMARIVGTLLHAPRLLAEIAVGQG